MEYSKSQAKLWARKNMKGLEVPIFPSFTPDLEKLDEEGIRFDVNHIYANISRPITGFMMCSLHFYIAGNPYTDS
jgi:hypothetical protein